MRVFAGLLIVALATLACDDDDGGLNVGYHPTGTGTGGASSGSGGNGSGAGSTGSGGDATGGGGEGGGSVLPTCLEDRFEGGSIGPAWQVLEDFDSTVAATGGQLQIDILTGASQSRTAYVLSQPLDIAECGAELEVVSPNPSDGMEVSFSARKDDWNYVAFNQRSSRLEMTRTVNNVTQVIGDIAYNASAHRWWRFEVVSGSVYWMASGDGVAWNELGSAVDTITLTNPRLRISGVVAPNTQNGSSTFDNFNPQ